MSMAEKLAEGQFLIMHTWLQSLLEVLVSHSHRGAAKTQFTKLGRAFKWRRSLKDRLEDIGPERTVLHIIRFHDDMFDAAGRLEITASRHRKEYYTWYNTQKG